MFRNKFWPTKGRSWTPEKCNNLISLNKDCFLGEPDIGAGR